ncbi:MAG: cadherin-like domain-containing protein [Parvularculaceae bacterium]|nr:cadherin-like domain-containing protein [Parvularculaceae bacterium]
MSAAAAIRLDGEKLELARLLEAARNGRLAAGGAASRRRVGQISQSSLVAVLLGLEGCKTIGNPGVAPEPPAPQPAPSPPPATPPPAGLVVGENRTTDIPVADLLAAYPGAASISKIVAVEHGTAVISGSVVQFTPTPGYEGEAAISFEYKNFFGRTRRGDATLTVDDDACGCAPEEHPVDGGSDHGGDVHADEQGGDDHGDEGHGDGVGSGGGDSHGDHGDGDSGAEPHAEDPAMQAEHLALLNLVPVSAATHIAVKSGSWFDPTVWASGVVPGDGAKVVIPTGVVIDYDGESDASVLTVRVDGALHFATDRDTHLKVDTLIVTPSGHLEIGTAEHPIDAGVRAVITIADNGPIDVAWDPTLLSRGVISHGGIDIHGAEKETFIKVAVDPMRGATSITLDSPPEGWRVGDRIVITGTHFKESATHVEGAPRTDTTEDEVLTITAINGNTISLDRPLQFDHDGARADLKAYVANYTRNVVIQSENGAATGTHERGHVMLMHSDDIDVRYAEFFELGRTDKSERAFDKSDLSNIESDSNLKGRYSLHIHRAGVADLDDPAMVVGNAVWGSPGWGYVHHDSNAIFAGNAAYNVFGAAFVAESGNETGRWVDNISILTLGVNNLSKDAADVEAFDLGRNGVGFWFQGRLVDAVGNVAAGSPGGHGFVYMHRQPQNELVDIDAATVPQGEKLRFGEMGYINLPNISIFKDNEAIAVRTGLEIVKASPAQGHDVRSVLADFTAWEVLQGAFLQYTGHYTLKGFDLVGADAVRGSGESAGLTYWTNVFDVVAVDSRIEGFNSGVRALHDTLFAGVTDFGYVFVDTAFSGNVRNYRDDNFAPHAPDRFIASADLANLPLDYVAARSVFDGPDTWFGEPSVELYGTKTDTLGRTETSPVWDPFNVNYWNIRGAVEVNGYWTLPDGRKVTLFEEYVTDRVTGQVEKFATWVDLPAELNLVPGAHGNGVRVQPVDHGLLDLNNAAPIVGGDAARVKSGESVVIDVLANDRDPEGRPLTLDALFSERGHVVINEQGKAVYFADPGFAGTDTFYYWAQDDQGNFAKAQVTVTVEI